ncbi:MAG: transcriptional regulator, AraC family [Herbinix sp.]|jgi:AraC-like DNA-binding protein|nr:transcriptional regulator, AraC family [Herbinix sp.]
MKYFDYRERRQQGTIDFPIAYYHIDPNHPRYQMPYHWHPEYEIIRILSGTFHLTLDSQSFVVKQGDILFLQDGVLHGGIPEQCIYECLVFDPKLFLKENHICAKLTKRLIEREIGILQHLPQDREILRDTVDHLFHTMSDQKFGYEYLIQGYLYQLLGIVLQEYLFEEKTTAAPSSYQHVLQFKKVLSYIEMNFTEHITLETMAKIAGMNAKYFCRFFKAMSYRTPIDYLNYYRIERACEQLSVARESMTEVALNCGFNDISYFIKTFRKYKGVTPKQYLRREVR